MEKTGLKRAVFLDRDGVINENLHDYVKQWAEFKFLSGTFTALERLANISLPIVIITNQSAVGRGMLDQQVLEEMHTRMTDMIHAHGGRIDKIVYCPHHPETGCDCRKPKPGLLKQAAEALNINLRDSYLVGDATSDIQAGLAVGCHTYLVLTGRGAAAAPFVAKHYSHQCNIVPDLRAAVDAILQEVMPETLCLRGIKL